MLAEWIAPTTLESFVNTYLHRYAWAQPASAKTAIPQVDWGVLAQVLQQIEAGGDVIVCARGSQLAYPAPRDIDELRAYMRMGISL